MVKNLYLETDVKKVLAFNILINVIYQTYININLRDYLTMSLLKNLKQNEEQ